MAYIVSIQTGTRRKGNFTRTCSTPLLSKEYVRRWIKRNPVGNANTKVTIKNTLTNKTITTTKTGGSIFGWRIK